MVPLGDSRQSPDSTRACPGLTNLRTRCIANGIQNGASPEMNPCTAVHKLRSLLHPTGSWHLFGVGQKVAANAEVLFQGGRHAHIVAHGRRDPYLTFRFSRCFHWSGVRCWDLVVALEGSYLSLVPGPSGLPGLIRRLAAVFNYILSRRRCWADTA
jgi:hypothetical protein